MAKHTTAIVLAFDPKARQSSRRGGCPASPVAAPDLAQAFALQKDEARQLAKALGVTEAALKSNKGRLWHHGHVVLAVEAAQGARLTAAARDAVLDALFDYHDLGYESGINEVGPARAAR